MQTSEDTRCCQKKTLQAEVGGTSRQQRVPLVIRVISKINKTKNSLHRPILVRGPRRAGQSRLDSKPLGRVKPHMNTAHH